MSCRTLSRTSLPMAMAATLAFGVVVPLHARAATVTQAPEPAPEATLDTNAPAPNGPAPENDVLIDEQGEDAMADDADPAMEPLAEHDGVITPPPDAGEADIFVPLPDADEARTPVIAPPGTPENQPDVVPK